MSGYEKHFKNIKKSKKQPRKRPRVQGPGLTWAISAILMFLLFATGFLNIDKVDSYLQKVEVNFIGPAIAAAEKATVEGLKGEKKSSKQTSESQDTCEPKKSYSEEDLSHFSKLNERKKQLDLREQELNTLEEELHRQRDEVEKRMAQLEGVRREISSTLKEKVEVDEERVKTLVDFYSNMKPKKAASVFNDLNEDLAIEVLGRMKKKNAAEIMNLLEPKKAQVLSEKYTGYKRR